jgi:hypothetical protein
VRERERERERVRERSEEAECVDLPRNSMSLHLGRPLLKNVDRADNKGGLYWQRRRASLPALAAIFPRHPPVSAGAVAK